MASGSGTSLYLSDSSQHNRSDVWQYFTRMGAEMLFVLFVRVSLLACQIYKTTYKEAILLYTLVILDSPRLIQ